MATMMATIDRAGRVVIPKEIRDRLGLNAEVELTVEGESLRLTPARVPGRQIVEIDGWPVLQPVPGVRTTDADVQRWRDADQR